MNTNQIIIISVFIIIIAVIIYSATRERFESDTELSSPYYTDIMHLYPGLYESYGVNKLDECLQNHNDYPGFKNCMLYMA